MLTYVEFKSSAFPPYSEESEEVNPGRYGKRLGEYLAQQLAEFGLPVQDLVAEDWGWVLPIDNSQHPLWIGIGNYEEHPDGFLCFIEPSSPKVRQFPKIWRTIDTTETVENLRLMIDNALAAHRDVSDVKWWSHDEFNLLAERNDA